MRARKDASQGIGETPDAQTEYIVEPLEWTEEQQREWIRGMAQLCVKIYSRQLSL